MTRIPVNVAEVIDNAKLGRFQIGVIRAVPSAACCWTASIRRLPQLIPAHPSREIGTIASALLGQVFGATNFGVLVGALTLPMLADKTGLPRPILIAGTIFLRAGNVSFTGFAASPEQLIILRFVGGVGLGCIHPQRYRPGGRVHAAAHPHTDRDCLRLRYLWWEARWAD